MTFFNKIFLGILGILIGFYLFVLNDNISIEKRAKEFSGISRIEDIKVVDSGATQEPPSDYIVFEVTSSIELEKIKKYYQLIKSNKLNSKDTNYFNHPTKKYIDYSKDYFVKDTTKKNGDFLEAIVQDNMVVFTVFYSN